MATAEMHSQNVIQNATENVTQNVTKSLTTHEQIGFELGWDYAHHHVTPPVPYAQEPSSLRHGWQAGQAAFGLRTLEPTRHVRKWLQLRLQAWLRGRSVELVQVTPHYLQQIDVSHCPITRTALSSATMEGTDASIDRVRSDAGYAGGNLVVMSTKANHAKAAYGFRESMAFATQIESGQLGGISGLNAVQWSRVAVLCSFVEPLPHEEACTLPMLVLPPNRLRLFNPVQALQAFVSQQLLVPGWSHRMARLEDLLPGKALKRSFQTFFHALLPRVLEAGKQLDGVALRWAVEDAWRNPLALQRWSAFAQQLTAAQCESLVARASAKKLGAQHIVQLPDALAVDGWNLETSGYVPHAVVRKRRPAPAAPAASLKLPQATQQMSLLH